MDLKMGLGIEGRDWLEGDIIILGWGISSNGRLVSLTFSLRGHAPSTATS